MKEAPASVLRLLVSVFRDLFRSEDALEAEIIVLGRCVANLRRRFGRKQFRLT